MNHPSLFYAWLAGIVEGEGSFDMSGKGLQVRVGMSDRDIIERIASALGRSESVQTNHRGPNRKTMYVIAICGPDAVGLMMTLYTFLGMRRRNQIRAALAKWRSTPRLRFINRWKLTPEKAATIRVAMRKAPKCSRERAAMARQFREIYGISYPSVYRAAKGVTWRHP